MHTEVWHAVAADRPCPICGKPDWCRRSADGSAIWCGRSTTPPSGWRIERMTTGGGALFFATTNGRNGQHRDRPAAPPRAPGQDWGRIAEEAAAALSDERCAALAAQLGVTAASLRAVEAGLIADVRPLRGRWDGELPDGCYCFPERDGQGRVVGLSLRAPDGRKSSPAGCKRGLAIPRTLVVAPDPVLVVEGATDTAALVSLGLAAVGRPSNSGGDEELAALLAGRDVLVIGESDQKPSGAWPGRDGAVAVAAALSRALGEKVKWSLPPDGVKDVRAWLQARVASGLDLADADARRAAGRDLLQALTSAAADVPPVARKRKETWPDVIMKLTLERFRVTRGPDARAFLVGHDLPGVALLVRGRNGALRGMITRVVRAETGRVPPSGAVADVIAAIEGHALDMPPEPVHLRVGRDDDGSVVLDLGRADGRVAVIGPDGWRVAESPILFERTVLVGEVPLPARDGDIELLRPLLNIGPDDWPVVTAWLAAALVPEIAHPALLLTGEQGSAKSTFARTLVGLIDPGPALLRAAPRDLEQWAVAAAASWCVAVDNLSSIPAWLSDILCRAVTGDGVVRRQLYADNDVNVLAYRRVLILNGIDLGGLRGDLADRALPLELRPIPPHERVTDAEVFGRFELIRPRVLGGLLDLLAGVLRELPNVRLDSHPRLADFARIAAAVDRVRGSSALPRFLELNGRIQAAVAADDPITSAIVALLERFGGRWSGSASDLLSAITPASPPSDWPRTAVALGMRLKRLVPSLRAVGVEAVLGRASDRTRARVVELRTTSDGLLDNFGRVGGATCPNFGAAPCRSVPLDSAPSDRSDGSDGLLRNFSNERFDPAAGSPEDGDDA